MNYSDFESEWRSGAGYITTRTSGSTGIPKEIRLDKEFVKASARATNRFFGLGPGARFHSCVSPDFIGGKMMAVRAFECNGILTYETPSNRILENTDSTAIDLLAVVPSQMIHLLERITSDSNALPEIRHIIIGGSALPETLRTEIAASGLDAYETYGMTETSSHIALRHVGDSKDRGFRMIADAVISTDVRGCLTIQYPSGYRVETNDIAEIISPGEFRILGRADDVIVTGGKKVNPQEVEKKLSGVFRFPFAITSVADEKWGEKVVIVTEKGDMSSSDILTAARVILQGWESPKAHFIVEQLPLTANGKLDRRTLKKNSENFE